MFNITIHINDFNSKNLKNQYSVWCDTEDENLKFLQADLTKNEALEVAQAHNEIHKSHLLRIEGTRADPKSNPLPIAAR